MLNSKSCLSVMQHTAELLPLLLRLLQQWRTAAPEPGLATFLMVLAVELMRALEPANFTPAQVSGQEAVKACHYKHIFCSCFWSGNSQGMPLYISSAHVSVRKQSRHATINISSAHVSGQEAVKACHYIYLLLMCLSGSSQGMPL